MDKTQKQEEIKLMTEHLNKAQAFFVADYRGLTVADITKLRRDLHDTGATSKVTKNTLVKRSIDSTLANRNAGEAGKLKGLLEGTNFFVLADSDVVSPAKVLAKFAAGNQKLKIKGAWFEDKFLDPSGVDSLSKMPSKEELIGKLLGLLNAPATQALRLLQAPASSLVRLLGAYQEKIKG